MKKSRVEEIIKKSPVLLLMMRHKKYADQQLYAVLRDCLEISEICLRDINEYEVLNRLIKKLPMVEGKNRQYVERSSDIYQRTCRYLFHNEEHAANVNRYAITLREAAKQRVTSKTLIDELRNGGINRFYLARPSQSQERMVSTKCLRLDRAIKHYKSDTIVLKLKRNVENIYEVLEFDDGTNLQQPRSASAPRRGEARKQHAAPRNARPR